MLPDVNKQPQAPAIVNHGLLFGHSFSPMLEHILKNAEQEQASHLGSAIRQLTRQVSGSTLFLGCSPSDLSISLVLDTSQYCYVGH